MLLLKGRDFLKHDDLQLDESRVIDVQIRLFLFKLLQDLPENIG